MAHSSLPWIASAALGAAAMYVLDPDDGRRRRAVLRDRAVSAARRRGRTARGMTHDWRNRTAGVVARLRSRSRDVDDAVVDARVRTALGRVCTHPGAIAAGCVDGVVELNGPILAREYDDVLRAVERTPGVFAVIDHMSQHEDPSNVPGLQGEHARPATSREWPLWALGAACGAAVLVYAAARRSPDPEHGVVSQDEPIPS